MGGLREMLFAIEITLVGITAAVLSILYDSFLPSVIAGGTTIIRLLGAIAVRRRARGH